jgi:hypothetical protein
VQHVDQTGHSTWPAPGITVTSTWTGWQASPRAVSDGSGGVIVLWVDGRNGWCSPSFMAECDVYGQRIDSSGNLKWGQDGKPISTATGNQGLQNLRAMSDGSGGALIAYADTRLAATYGGTTLYLQRVNGNGDGLWANDGIRIGQDPAAGDAGVIGNVRFLGDGSGGTLAAWYLTSSKNGNSEKSVRAQRITSVGQVLWSSGGVVVPGVSATDSNGSGTQTFDTVSDGAGGMIIAASWTLPNTGVPIVFAQKVDAIGTGRWGANASRVSTSNAVDPSNTIRCADGSDDRNYSECCLPRFRIFEDAIM